MSEIKSTAVQTTQSQAMIAQKIAFQMDRMRAMTVGGRKLNDQECIALAQVAAMHDLDATVGEIWYIPGSGPMIGIKGLRRKSREAIRAEMAGANWWGNHFEITDPDIRKRWGIPDGALAFEFRVYDTVTLNYYIKTVGELKTAGMPWEVITSILGERPYTSGVGYWKPGEPTKMTPVQCAQKRAEADALKKRFDINISLAVADDEPGSLGPEWKEVNPAEREAKLNPGLGISDADPLNPPTPENIGFYDAQHRTATPETHTANARKLGRPDSDGFDLSEPTPPGDKTDVTPAASDGKSRVIKHRDAAIDLLDRLTPMGVDVSALERAIKAANLSLERGNGDTTLHSHADRLKQLVATLAPVEAPITF